MDHKPSQWPIDGVSAGLAKRIGCFHSNVDFGVTTHLFGVRVSEARLAAIGVQRGLAVGGAM